MSLEESNEAAKAVAKTENRVDLESIKEKIDSVEYIIPGSAPHFTIAVVKLKNGYLVTGESAPADPNNYNQELGQKFAYEAAVRKIWPMEGYLLCEKLANTPVDPQPASDEQNAGGESSEDKAAA